MSCAECRFVFLDTLTFDSEPILQCRRWAPRPVPQPDEDRKTVYQFKWPEVTDEDWCGEYRAEDRRTVEEG